MDIDPAYSSGPVELTAYGESLAFVAPNGPSLRTLWLSQGTVETTRPLIRPNPDGYGEVVKIATAGDRLFFFTTKLSSLMGGLWVSDGTEAGTRFLKDLPSSNSVKNLTAFGSDLYFTLEFNLWKSDGTSAGTGPFSEGKFSSVSELTRVGNSLFISAFSTGSGWQIWKTDGTESGIFLVAGVSKDGFWSPVSLTELDGVLIFVKRDVSVSQLWRSNGTLEGTFQIAEEANSYVFSPSPLPVAGGFAFFVGRNTSGLGLWKTDGTSTGTGPVSDVIPRFNATDYFAVGSWTELNGRLFFAAEGKNSGPELWITDGTSQGTRLVLDIQPGTLGSYPSSLTGFKSQVLFLASTIDDGQALWSSDGTPTGTVRLRRLGVEPTASSPGCLTAVGDKILFSAFDGSGLSRLWSVDRRGRAEILGDVAPMDRFNRCQFVVASGKLFFTGSSPEGRDLWKSDGTAAGTVPLTKSLIVKSLTAVKDGVAFVGGGTFAGDSRGYEPWFSDGTAAGTYLLKDIAPGSASSFTPDSLSYAFADLGSKFYFGAKTSIGNGLWESDGTPEGTKLVKSIGMNDDYPHGLLAFKDSLYFFTNAGLWKSDGTSGGTEFLSPTGILCKGRGFGSVLKERFYFGSTNLDNVLASLWSSDGTAAGTVKVVDFGSNAVFSCPNIAVSNDIVFIITNPESFEEELWRSDGTPAGTLSLVKFPSASVGLIFPFDVGGGVVFAGYDGLHGTELWSSDGTVEGTGLWFDLASGVDSSSPDSFALLGNRLFFSATSPSFGRELWFLSLSGLNLLPERLSTPRIVRPR